MIARYSSAWRGVPALAGFTLVALVPAPAGAVGSTPVRRMDDERPPQERRCEPMKSTTATLRMAGRRLVGDTISLDATNAKVRIRTAACRDVVEGINEFSWSLQRPNGSRAELRANGLRPTLVPDRAGTYGVTLTICANGCGMGAPRKIVRASATVADTIWLPPATEPEVPPGQATSPTVASENAINRRCQVGFGEANGITDPQWVTIEPFRSAQDYKLLEGTAAKSRVSRKDMWLNHDQNDLGIKVAPDPLYRNMLVAPSRNADPYRGRIEIEWESNRVPEVFWPTPGDRVSAFGYWIHDCGHEDGKNSEVHPPVGMASHRARPIQIPADARFDLDGDGRQNDSVGQNVWVPGIVSDVWFNKASGKITECPDDVGLAQPSANGSSSGGCIRGPSSIARSFQYRIALPLSPSQVLRQNGVDARPTPLFFRVLPDPSGLANVGPDPEIEVQTAESDGKTIAWLRVTVDLSRFNGARYGRRIVAGWVNPDADNWGLKKWNVSVPKLHVRDDAEINGEDGDWRFWLNSNAGSVEWRKILTCNGCIDDPGGWSGSGEYRLGRRPFIANATGPNGELPVTRLFPGQTIFIQSAGYDDEDLQDDTGGVIEEIEPSYQAQSYSFRSSCEEQLDSGCGSYDLHVTVSPGAAEVARLSAPATALHQAFGLSRAAARQAAAPAPAAPAATPSTPRAALDVGLGPAMAAPELAARVSSRLSDIVLGPGEVMSVNQVPALETNAERGMLMRFNADTFSKIRQRPNGAAKLDRLMKAVRTRVDARYTRLPKNTVVFLRALKGRLPADMWTQYFGDLENRMRR